MSEEDKDAVKDLQLRTRMFKLRKKLDPDQVDDLDAMDAEQLRNRIAQCETNILESEKAKAADSELVALRARVKEMNAPYAEIKKIQRALAEYAACLLDERGQV
jgi:hypothetical protein